ncbi:MAG: orotate phosphoribosyltransferase [Oscillospiraceae bacterium]|nr:orotate phosphoribosyltransferase [Oscillospiraceae bacterium]
MLKDELAKSIYRVSHITGEFVLRSGQVSNEYFDKYLFEADPEILAVIAKAMKNIIPQGTEVIAGLEMGGIPLVTALALETGMKAAFVRKKAKEYGTCRLAEGADVEGKSVCIIEDIVTTGGQQIESARELRKRGAVVDFVLCVILRNESALEAFKKENITLIPLFTMDYIKEVSNAYT